MYRECKAQFSLFEDCSLRVSMLLPESNTFCSDNGLSMFANSTCRRGLSAADLRFLS